MDDGAEAADHDRFRGVEGAFAGALQGVAMAKQAGIEFQINTTITKSNLDQITAIQELAEQMGVGEPRFPKKDEECFLCGLCDLCV